jgi:hypothetical protein
MFVLGFGVLGALIGAFQARRRKGSGMDIAQYAAGYGIAFAILGLFANLVLLRMI